MTLAGFKPPSWRPQVGKYSMRVACSPKSGEIGVYLIKLLRTAPVVVEKWVRR